MYLMPLRTALLGRPDLVTLGSYLVTCLSHGQARVYAKQTEANVARRDLGGVIDNDKAVCSGCTGLGRNKYADSAQDFERFRAMSPDELIRLALRARLNR